MIIDNKLYRCRQQCHKQGSLIDLWLRGGFQGQEIYSIHIIYIQTEGLLFVPPLPSSQWGSKPYGGWYIIHQAHMIALVPLCLFCGFFFLLMS